MESSKKRSEDIMKKQTLGMMIASLRKEKGMTQMELAEKMGITDKAVSKWERDLSCPDENSLPKLAEIFDVTVDELMQVKTEAREEITKDKKVSVELICKAVALAMGVAVVVLSILDELPVTSGLGMLGVGLIALSICQFLNKKEE